MSVSTDFHAPTAASRAEQAAQLGGHLQRLLITLPLRSVSLHDATGELLWLSEGAFGPDEHHCVLQALDAFELEHARVQVTHSLNDGRSLAFVCARTPTAACCGVAAFLIGDGVRADVEQALGSPRVAAALRRLAILMAPEQSSTVGVVDIAVADVAAAPTHAAAISLTTTASTTTTTAMVDGVGRAALQARRYARLRAGGTTQRYEMEYLDAAAESADALTLATRVIEHLARRRERFHTKPASFLLSLGAASVDPAYVARLTPALRQAALPPDTLGFLLPATTWTRGSQALQRFAAECAATRCFVALDDFDLRDAGFEQLNLPALRCVKLDAALIARVLNDKFAQATVAAIVQAARVLGLYCIAKGVASATQAQWLAAAGVEFSDGRSRASSAANTAETEMSFEVS